MLVPVARQVQVAQLLQQWRYGTYIQRGVQRQLLLLLLLLQVQLLATAARGVLAGGGAASCLI